jgi:peptidylprolyl isomerase domain and WD repeat-containing protein 1
MYERSFMHVETVTHTACAAGDFIITGSKVHCPARSSFRSRTSNSAVLQDGIIKFWKKRPQEIEFIKKFFAHTGSVRDIAVSSDGLWLATLGERLQRRSPLPRSFALQEPTKLLKFLMF